MINPPTCQLDSFTAEAFLAKKTIIICLGIAQRIEQKGEIDSTGPQNS